MKMNERRRIEERLRKKESEIQELEGQIRDARIYVQALQDVLKMIPRESEEAASAASLRSGSAMSKVRDFILKERRAAHIGELLTALGREPSRENRASLSGSLAAYVRKGEVFTRPAPNTFGLIELGHANTVDAITEEPPPDFGVDRPKGPAEEDDEIPF